MSDVITQFGISGISMILDKSAFHSLSKSQIELLCKYYWFNITPILVREVLGDLKKETPDGSPNSKKVTEFATKLSGFSTSINAHYSVLINAELQGMKIPFFSSMVDTGERFNLSDKETGIIIKPSNDRKSIDRWKEGNFEKMDEIFSRLWREITLQPDNLTKLKDYLKKENPGYNHLKSPADILFIIKLTFNNPDFQMDFLKSAIENFKVPPFIASQAFYRWETMRPDNLFAFAPYTFFCVLTKLFFNICLQNEIIGARPTNLLDLDYLYYLPFCRVFVSDDKVHKKLVPHLLVSEQVFVTGMELKNDFIRIEEIKATLTGKELQRTHREPPRKTDLLSYKIWNSMLVDWPPEKDWEPTEKEENMMQEMIRKMRSSGKFD
jgi:hypothetical protein